MKRVLLSAMFFCMACLAAWADNPNPIAIIDTPEDSLSVEGSIEIKGIAGPSGGANLNDPKGWKLEYGAGDSPTTWTELTHGHSPVGLLPNTFAPFYTWDTTSVSDETYCVRLTVNDSEDKTATDTHKYYVSNGIQ